MEVISKLQEIICFLLSFMAEIFFAILFYSYEIQYFCNNCICYNYNIQGRGNSISYISLLLVPFSIFLFSLFLPHSFSLSFSPFPIYRSPFHLFLVSPSFFRSFFTLTLPYFCSFLSPCQLPMRKVLHQFRASSFFLVLFKILEYIKHCKTSDIKMELF